MSPPPRGDAAPDVVLVVRLLRDDRARAVDAVIEFANHAWRSVYGAVGRIYMSGCAPEAVFGNDLLDEGTPFLRKPFAREDLASRVQTALDRREPAG